MSKYDDFADTKGVTLEPFTSGYLDLYDDGLGILEGFIEKNPEFKIISTTELEEFVKKSREIQRRIV